MRGEVRGEGRGVRGGTRQRRDAVHVRVKAWVRWPDGADGLRRWIVDRGFVKEGESKPARPKEAFVDALRHRKIQRSSALYRDLAKVAKFRTCTDSAFQRLISTLQTWFPA